MISWIDVSEPSSSYEGTKLHLEAAVYSTKDEFEEQLLLGQTEQIKQGMIVTLWAIEQFMLAAERERQRLLRQIAILEQQRKAPNHPRLHDRFRDHQN